MLSFGSNRARLLIDRWCSCDESGSLGRTHISIERKRGNCDFMYMAVEHRICQTRAADFELSSHKNTPTHRQTFRVWHVHADSHACDFIHGKTRSYLALSLSHTQRQSGRVMNERLLTSEQGEENTTHSCFRLWPRVLNSIKYSCIASLSHIITYVPLYLFSSQSQHHRRCCHMSRWWPLFVWGEDRFMKDGWS